MEDIQTLSIKWSKDMRDYIAMGVDNIIKYREYLTSSPF